MIDLNSLAPLTPENIHRIKPLMYLGRGAVKAMAWIDDDTLAVATSFALWHYTRDGGQREVVRFGRNTLSDYSILKFSDDGKTLMVWDSEKNIFLYDSFSGEVASVLIGQHMPWNFDMTCTDAYLAITVPGKVEIFEIATGEQIADFDMARVSVSDLIFVGQELLIVAKGNIYYYAMETRILRESRNREMAVFRKKLFQGTYMGYHDDSFTAEFYTQVVYPKMAGKSIDIWNGQTYLYSLNGHEHKVKSVYCLSDKMIVSVDEAENVLVWRDRLLIGRQAQMGTQYVCANAAVTAVAAVNPDHEVVIWDRERGEKRCFPHGHVGSVGLFEFDGDTLVSAVNGGRAMHHWSLHSGEIIHTLNFPLSFALLSPDKRMIVRTEGRAYVAGTLVVRKLNSGETLFSREVGAPICFTQDSLLYAPDCSPGKVGSAVPGMGVFEIGESAEFFIMKVNLETGKEEPFLSLAPDNRLYLGDQYYAISARDQGVAVFDFETHHLRGIFHPKYEVVATCKFSPDQRRILIASHGGGVMQAEMWEIESGQQVMREEMPGGVGVVFSPDSRFIAFTDEENGIRLWKEGRVHAHLPAKQVFRVVFSPDSRLLFGVCSLREEIYVWDTETAARLVTLTEVRSQIGMDRIVLRPDLFAISNNNGTIGLWGVES